MRVLVTGAAGFVGRHVVIITSVVRPPGKSSSTGSEKCVVFYQMTEFYRTEGARAIWWNNPVFGMTWRTAELTEIS